MAKTRTRFFIAGALVVELAALCYGTLMAWLLSVWFFDDAAATGMQSIDWWAIAAEWLVMCAFAGVVAAGGVLLINRWLASFAGQTATRWPLATAALFVVFPLGAAVLGALQFGMAKPFM